MTAEQSERVGKTARRRSRGHRLVALPVEEWNHRSAEVIGGAGRAGRAAVGDGGLHHVVVISPVVPDHKPERFEEVAERLIGCIEQVDIEDGRLRKEVDRNMSIGQCHKPRWDA
jgi:hypothetical protein